MCKTMCVTYTNFLSKSRMYSYHLNFIDQKIKLREHKCLVQDYSVRILVHVPLSSTFMLTTPLYQDSLEGVGEIKKGKKNAMFAF